MGICIVAKLAKSSSPQREVLRNSVRCLAIGNPLEEKNILKGERNLNVKFVKEHFTLLPFTLQRELLVRAGDIVLVLAIINGEKV